MARQITIPITDTPDCVAYYLVEYKLAGSDGYEFSQQYFDTPIVLDNLLDNTEYEIRITRYCCNGVSATPVDITVNTAVIPAPASITLNQVGANVDSSWPAVSGATVYQLQRATDAGFTTDLTDLYEGGLLAYTDVSPGGGTFWYRVRASNGGYYWSAYVSDDITLV